jgi:hydroxymethylpyrimidine/phosphomethylpyrimidine kinase
VWCSEFDHLEIFLASPTLRTDPIGGYIFPPGTRCNALIGRTGLFIVDPATDKTHPGSHGFLFICIDQYPERCAYPALGGKCIQAAPGSPINYTAFGLSKKPRLPHLTKSGLAPVAPAFLQTATTVTRAAVPTLILTFAPSDPTAATGVQADLLTCASMGCHALSVVTALSVQDSAGIEDVQPMSPDFIDDQARCLLEDMPVRAFKIGALYSPEAVSAVAQVMADYADVPVVLHLGHESPPGVANDEEDTADDVLDAILELLVPQATLVVVDHGRLEQWHTNELLPTEEGENAIQALLSLGADWVLATGVPHAGGPPVNVLAGENPQAEAWPWQLLPGSYRGAGSTLSAALTALLGGGMDVRQAVIEAQQYTWQALDAGFRPGMGRMLPDRMFWARTEGTSGDESPGTPEPEQPIH